MDGIKIISQTGIFKGLQDKKSDLINLRMSEINDPNKKIRVISNSGAKVVRLLLDIEPNNFEELINYLFGKGTMKEGNSVINRMRSINYC
mgnify:CR=1 FL=1